MAPTNLRSAVEALLFSSDQPLTLALMSEALETPVEELAAALQALGEDYIARDAGIEVREMSGGWIVMTRPEQAEWIGRMLRGKRKTRLSRAALETMAIIAYKQPVTKSEVEAIRGVDASGVLATLLERNLVTIKGRSTVVGRPLLYGTTNEFLNYFGLRDLTELPRPEELRALVAAREPEQMEMLELDPDTGMPLLAEAGAAAVAVLAADSLEGEAAATTADEGEERHARAASADDEESFDEDDDEEFEDDEDSDDSDEEEFEDDDDSDEDLDADEDEDEDDDDEFSLADADAALDEAGVVIAGDLAAADDSDDDDLGDDDDEDDEDFDEDDDEDFDDDLEDDEDDSDEDDLDEADESHPTAHLSGHDESR